MPKRLQPRLQRTAITSLVCFGLLLAACTRSATTATVPTAGPTDNSTSSTQGVVQPSNQDATMAAIGTEVAGQLTQTAVAAAGGTQEQTPVAPGTTAPEAGATDTQPALGQPSDTPGGPAPTEPAQPATSTPIPASGAPCPNPYTVQQGDWIYKIARNCNVAVSALIAANPGVDPNAISPGQQLNMPGAGATPVQGSSQPACSGTHTVVTGDNLYQLAFACGLTIEQLAAANGIPYPYTIYPGQVLKIP
jgi:LysM repeat protein